MKTQLLTALFGITCLGLAQISPVAGSPVPLSPNEMSQMVGGACDACASGWVSVSNMLGGLECEHGPEHDNSAPCVAARNNGNIICKELFPATGNCECFKCQGIPYQDPFSLTCEGEIRTFMAWCGVDASPEACGPNETCDTEPDPNSNNDPLRMESGATVVGGGICSGSHGHFAAVRLCGDPPHHPWGFFACKSDNCQTQGNWQTAFWGKRTKCK
jgi:hypothetical protein